MDFSREGDVRERGLRGDKDRKALTEVSVKFNYGEIGNELWLAVKLVRWFRLVAGVVWN